MQHIIPELEDAVREELSSRLSDLLWARRQYITNAVESIRMEWGTSQFWPSEAPKEDSVRMADIVYAALTQDFLRLKMVANDLRHRIERMRRQLIRIV